MVRRASLEFGSSLRDTLAHHLSPSVCVYLCVLPHAQAASENMPCYMIHPALPDK